MAKENIEGCVCLHMLNSSVFLYACAVFSFCCVCARTDLSFHLETLYDFNTPPTKTFISFKVRW